MICDPEYIARRRKLVDEMLADAGIRKNYRPHGRSVLLHCETQEQMQESIDALRRNCRNWFSKEHK